MKRALILLGALLLASAAHAATSTSSDQPVVAQSLESFKAEVEKDEPAYPSHGGAQPSAAPAQTPPRNPQQPKKEKDK